jgi:DNA-binding NtrC family response regulator
VDLIRIDERLPELPLHSEVVLHLRRHLRAAIRERASSASADLAHLFGFARTEGSRKDWIAAACSPSPIQAGASVAAQRRTGKEVVTLGYDNVHLLECKRWLADRKQMDDSFSRIKASDLATLLELSKARDIATARGVDDQRRERFLPVVIQGPTGTGKELLAQAIHALWTSALGRPDAPWQVIQVAGLPPEMINDELFGHVRGAYTGANELRVGRLEAADGGTLLIDEVGDLPRDAQLRLLRFLQTQTISRLGENTERQLSVRIIAATLHNLDEKAAAGSFREDLLHRLRVGDGLVLQPLQKREGFFDEVLPELFRARGHAAVPMIARSARDALAVHAWPGNLRELVGVLDEALAHGAQETIRLEHLPPRLQHQYLAQPLYERALGFLLDEVDGQGLSDGHIAWRISELTQSFERAPLPVPNEQLATVGQFLSLLDDSSPEHRLCVAEVQQLLGLEQVRERAAQIEAFWCRVLTVDLPPAVAPQVLEAAQVASEVRSKIGREIEAAKQAAHIESNPWLRLFQEIHGLPLLRGANAGELGKAFLAAFNFVKLFAPSFIDQLRDDARAGGFARIRERVIAVVRDAKNEPIDRVLAPGNVPSGDTPSTAIPPGRLSRSDWQDITRRFQTQRAAVDATGYDPKTIAKYLRKHRIPHPWKLNR